MAGLRKPRAGVLVGLLALALCGLLVAQFHRRGRSEPAATGVFDYYLLSLSWAPEFCAQPGAAAGNGRECATGRNIGFVVHGLWPEANSGKSPESCGPAQPVAKAVVNVILPYMPGTGLIQHEWATHGTCTGLTPGSYFTTVIQARSEVQIPVQLTALEETAKESPEMIEMQFEGTNPAFPEGAFRVACRNGALTEVRACFDKGLKPQVCTSSAGECTASSIAILPPR